VPNRCRSIDLPLYPASKHTAAADQTAGSPSRAPCRTNSCLYQTLTNGEAFQSIACARGGRCLQQTEISGNRVALPRSMEVELKKFDVDIELIRVKHYTIFGLVYHHTVRAMVTSPCDGQYGIVKKRTLELRWTFHGKAFAEAVCLPHAPCTHESLCTTEATKPEVCELRAHKFVNLFGRHHPHGRKISVGASCKKGG